MNKYIVILILILIALLIAFVGFQIKKDAPKESLGIVIVDKVEESGQTEEVMQESKQEQVSQHNDQYSN
jgi:hypothetical protein|tara:strand:- start:11347 stop:11553 length:207 start_codon:yes stop_codon:yes gene_type:complete